MDYWYLGSCSPMPVTQAGGRLQNVPFAISAHLIVQSRCFLSVHSSVVLSAWSWDQQLHIATVNVAMETLQCCQSWPLKGGEHLSTFGEKPRVTFPSGHMSAPNGVPHVHWRVLTCGNTHRHPGWLSKQITGKLEVQQTVKKGCDFHVLFSTRKTKTWFRLF